MDDIARCSIACGLQEAFALAAAVNEDEPLVRLSYADGCATLSCATAQAELEQRVMEARATAVS